jgi:transcriptional regulator GlxA family with amidase domain
MITRHAILSGLALLALALGGFGIWMSSLPRPVAAAAPPISQAETGALLAALRPPKRARPLVAIVGLNNATETNDYLVSTGILRRADVADVFLLATGPGPVRLYPALSVLPDATIGDFDRRHSDGADYVIVPAMSRDDDTVVLAWLREQARKGAIIIGVCAGAKVVAAAGLLDGKRATTHWYYRKEMLSRHPSIRYVPDRRMVADGHVVTTTGITAAIPTMLTLIEAIAGRVRAEAVARDLGVSHWDARHASSAFAFTRPFAAVVLGNVLAFWNREQVRIDLMPRMDEVSVALVADAWSRTYRSKAVTFAASRAAIKSRNGIRIIPDDLASNRQTHVVPASVTSRRPAEALDRTLAAIGERYGRGTADVVAMQLEYLRPQFSLAVTASRIVQ